MIPIVGGDYFTSNESVKIGLAFGIIALLICMSITPSIGISNNDDTTPPVTTHTLEPPEPDGCNGWYVSDVTVTLNATDDISGVKEIYYQVDGSSVVTVPGEVAIFLVTDDSTMHTIKYWAVDNVGNTEPKNTINFKQDQTYPDLELTYEFEVDPLLGWIFIFTVNATDITSTMDRVEFYLNDVLQETVVGPGPVYQWIWDYSKVSYVRGLILNPEITEEYVRFYAILVGKSESGFHAYFCAYAYDNAGNWAAQEIVEPCSPVTMAPGIYLFESLTLPNNYKGYIGRFFIFASFDTS